MFGKDSSPQQRYQWDLSDGKNCSSVAKYSFCLPIFPTNSILTQCLVICIKVLSIYLYFVVNFIITYGATSFALIEASWYCHGISLFQHDLDGYFFNLLFAIFSFLLLFSYYRSNIWTLISAKNLFSVKTLIFSFNW